MYIADRLRRLREAKKLSQGDIEKRTGLLRCYISRVENGHTVPSIETLEKISHALELPMYQIFLGAEGGDALPTPLLKSTNGWESGRSGRKYLNKLTHAIAKLSDDDKTLLLFTATKMATKPRRNGHLR